MSTIPTNHPPDRSAVDDAVASGGSYEVLAKRLDAQGQALEKLARELNEARLEEFGRSQMEVIARMRVRTENNCLGRDIAQVGGTMSKPFITAAIRMARCRGCMARF